MHNPLKRIRDFVREPGLIGTPPSKRSMWHDPAEHARDFAERYAEPMNYHVENRMMELGIDPLKLGVGDPEHGIQHAAFVPHEADGGGILLGHPPHPGFPTGEGASFCRIGG
jgi:hypothetical protein